MVRRPAVLENELLERHARLAAHAAHGQHAASAGNEVAARSSLKRTLLGEAVTTPETKPSGMRASTLAEIAAEEQASGPNAPAQRLRP